MKLNHLLLLLCLTISSVGCAARKLHCRFTTLDAQHHPIPPSDAWVYGYDHCMTELRTLATMEPPPPETIGVEIRGSKAQRELIRQQIMNKPKLREEKVKRIKMIDVKISPLCFPPMFWHCNRWWRGFYLFYYFLYCTTFFINQILMFENEGRLEGFCL